MKRILGVLISSVMLAVTCLTALPVSAKEEYTEYIVPFYSDQTKQKQVVGISNKSLLKDGVVLIPLETACEIAGATIAAENDEAVVITRNYVSWCCEYKDEKNQYLLVDSNTGKGNFYKSALKCLTESSWSGTSFKYSFDDEGINNLPVDNFNKTKISCKYYDGELYVSFYDFLVMMGVGVKVADKATQAELVKPFLNAIGISANENAIDDLINYIYWQVMGDCDADIFFSCCLGTPIDKLYMDYYETQSEVYMCDLTDYYTDGDVKWANLVNSAASFNGLTETALAAMNMNTDYSEALVNVVSNVGGNWKNSEDSEASLQDIAFLLQYGWDSESLSLGLIENMEDIAGIVSNAQDSKFTGIDLGISDGISIAFGAYTTGLEYYDKYNALDTLFENDKNLLKNSILNSEHMKQAASDEYGDDFFSKLGNFFGRGAVITKDLLNTSNSYINLYRSAVEVQSLIETSAPATWGAIQKAYKGAASATLDTVILKTIDGFAFSGVPVTELAVQFVQLLSKSISKTAYVEQQSKIAEFDDYIFIQEVAKGCFDDYSLGSENAFSTFVLGIKASMTAYEAENEQNKSKKIQGRLECLEKMLSDTTFANRNFYLIDAKGCGDLTEMLSSNTDISKLDTTPRQDITLEYAEKTTEPTETSFESETIDFEGIYYNYIENELLSQYGLAELAVARDYSSNTTHTNLLGIVSAAIYDFCDDGTEELLVLTREKTDDVMSAYYLNLYQYTGNKVEPLDRIETEEYSIHSGGEHGDSFEMIIAGNAVYQQLRTSRYGSSGPDANTTEYTIIDVNGYKFNKYQYSVNPVNVVDKSLNTILHHDKTICADFDFSDGCTECGLNTSITDAENAIRQKLNEIAFPYASCTLSSENGLALNIGVNENMKICDYSSYQKFETIDYTKLRDHIATPQGADFSISSYTGRYGKDNIYVEISPVGDSEVNVSVEFQNEAKIILSGISYTGIAEQSMSFEASDYNSLNAYSIDFLEDSVHLKFHQLEYVNEIYPMDMPDTDIILPRLSTQTINRDISSWTNEMIANAINHSLQLYYADYYVLGSEIEENEYGKYVYTHHKSGEPPTPQTNYIVTWDDQDDVAYFAVDSADSFVRFHITDFDPNYASFIPAFDISGYYGKYAAADCNLWLEITESENSNAEIFITFCNDSGSKVSESWFTGSVKTNPFTFTADDGWGKNSYTLEFIEDEIIVSANCIECTSGLWSIPSISGAVLQKETVVINTTTWQHLYADELRNYMNSDSYSSDAMFDLYDFDNNGILELIISSGEAHLCTCSIFGIKNGALTLLCEDVGEYGSISAYEGGVVCGTFTPSGPGQTTKYTRFVKISSGDSQSLYELTAEGFPPDYDRYTINGTEATEEEYRNIMNQYITQEPLQYSIGRKHPLDESTINSVLLS